MPHESNPKRQLLVIGNLCDGFTYKIILKEKQINVVKENNKSHA